MILKIIIQVWMNIDLQFLSIFGTWLYLGVWLVSQPLMSGQSPNKGQDPCSQYIRYSEVPLYYMYTHELALYQGLLMVFNICT